MTHTETTLPDPSITGPCQLQASPFCTGEGVQRLDPMQMLSAETAFKGYTSACQPCYDTNADRFVAERHGR